jgi:hypothetical protein
MSGMCSKTCVPSWLTAGKLAAGDEQQIQRSMNGVKFPNGSNAWCGPSVGAGFRRAATPLATLFRSSGSSPGGPVPAKPASQPAAQ